MAHQVQVASTLPPGVPAIYLPNRINAVAGQTVTLTDEEFAQLAPDIFSKGYLTDLGAVGMSSSAPSFQATGTAASTLTTGTLTAGSLSYQMPFNGASYKKFVLNLAGASTTGATITFPTAFTVAPAIIGVGDGVETAITTGFTATTTVLTIPALTTQTGWILVEGW